MVLVLNPWLYKVTSDDVNVRGDKIADQRVFVRELPEEFCSCTYISMSPKTIFCCVKYCVQVRSSNACCLNSLKVQVVPGWFLSIL